MGKLDCDVVVVSAGLTGAAASARLCEGGQHVIILEGRDRVGGRAYTRPFKDDATGKVLEFGGAWITPGTAIYATLSKNTD